MKCLMPDSFISEKKTRIIDIEECKLDSVKSNIHSFQERLSKAFKTTFIIRKSSICTLPLKPSLVGRKISESVQVT